MSATPQYSFVIPIFNEEETLSELERRIAGLLAKLDGPSEVILIDDGSRDRSAELIRSICARDSRFKGVFFSRNFGHQTAITAGMDFSQGQAVIILDADLQDPPETALDLIAKWKEGYEIVYAVRAERKGETWFKRLSASAFYRALRAATQLDIPTDTGDFRLVDRKALDAFLAMRESNRYVRGMFSWVGFRQIGVEYVREERFAGSTKYPLHRMLKLARDGVLSFSTFPLQVAMNLGLLISIISLGLGLYFIYLKLSGGHVVTGWTSLVVITTFLSGTQLMVIGFLGQYVGRIHEEVKNRPLYVVRHLEGFPTKQVRDALKVVTPRSQT